ncbi:hypothetical protein ACFX2F_028365 [Malus domestica]
MRPEVYFPLIVFSGMGSWHGAWRGLVAKDNVSNRGAALNSSLSQVLVNWLRYYIRRPETDIDNPDPVQDFCIANTEPTSHANQCKNSSLATVEDFVFSGVRVPGKFGPSWLSGVSVNSNVFPGLNTLGMSFVRPDFEVGGVNVPHFHPRATEIAFVLEGKIY